MDRAAGILSIIAALLHGVAGPAHFEAWWGYGLFFVFAAAAQFLFGLALATRAINPLDFGSGWQRARRRLIWAGILGNLVIIAFYLLTRTVGIPVGPESGLVEEVGALDAVSKVAEVALIILLVWILAQERQRPAEVRH